MEKYEDKNTEFKREYTDNLKKTIIAFANTEGGTIYIGVADDGKPVGIADYDSTLLKITSAIREGIKPDITLFVDYQQEKVNGKKILKVIVQTGTASPYYLSAKGIRPEGVFIRHGSSSIPAAESAILKMIKETDGEKYEDVRSLNQDLTFKEAQQLFAERNIPFRNAQKKTLHLLTPDGIFTNLGLLLSDQSVHSIKLAVFEGLEKDVFKDRREFSGSLLKQANEVYAFLDMYNKTQAEVKGLYRTDKRDYPEEAVREALLNAIVHRDYSFSASSLITVFDDRIEFVSIGGLQKNISLNDIMLGLSIPRNENLANVFYRLELIEAYGTGIPKIMRSYENETRKPELQVSDNAFKITLPNRNAVQSISVSVENLPSSMFNKNEMKVLTLFATQKELSRQDIEATLLFSQSMAVRTMKSLAEKQAIIVIGKGKNTRYRKS
jgi:ATP-dependent DNA helicase RecG